MGTSPVWYSRRTLLSSTTRSATVTFHTLRRSTESTGARVGKHPIRPGDNAISRRKSRNDFYVVSASDTYFYLHRTNCAIRTFDLNGRGTRFWLAGGEMGRLAAELVAAFKVKTASLASPIAALSGGNVQRAVLARELSGAVDLLIISNPCFGLDFSAVAEIRARIVAARNGGAAVLLMSEDLDEVLELADRVLVMSEGRIAWEAPAGGCDIAEIGRHMAGHA